MPCLRFGSSSAYLGIRQMFGSGGFHRFNFQPAERLLMSLTKRQREILTYLGEYSEVNGYAPSFEEIAAKFNYNSLATVHEHLTNLQRKGYIKRAYNESRGIEVLPSNVLPRASAL